MTTLTEPASVLISGRPGILRSGIELLLASDEDCEVTGVADSSMDAVRLVRMRRPAVAIVDLTDDVDGPGPHEAVQALIGASPTTAIVAMLATADPIIARDVLRHGAAGCITRAARPETLLDAAHRAATGDTYLESRIAVALAHIATQHGDGDLTPREYEVLRLVALGHTNREIAEHLYLSVRTIESHRSRIHLKLGVERRSELVQAARDAGLIG